MSRITGLHHVTAIAGDAQENLDFYTTVLGLRLVKRSVNQDAPGTYHLFYADAVGHPGTDLTFFPWPDLPPGRRGIGLTNEVALAVPTGSLDYWTERLAQHDVQAGELTTRFGERTLTFLDVHGLALALVETSDPREFSPWPGSPVPEQYQIRGLHAARMAQRDLGPTTRFLTEGMGFRLVASEDGWQRYALGEGGSGHVLDVQALPDAPRGTWGMGSVHHVAWRVADSDAEVAAQRAVRAAGAAATDVIDRFWFRSVYFKEPGGALFEIATDGPGFAVDEPTETLGDRLILPPWLEPRRAEIEQALPPLRSGAGAR
ncbi:MAG TPA: ring-cleaving dioxygenase [Gemmatimonadaceae bacterium]|nr:ring-cleaving dioxygenase [Gemmatimonadaceae bacterium]